jgi:asparagine synthase (glutamine-hydrolysing)
LLEAPTTVEAYKNLLGYRQAVNLLSERNNAAFSGVFRRDVTFDPALPVIANMMLLDASTYLMDDILAKVDRATMAVSLEARCPFLDHRLAEWAGALPLRYKVNGGRGKLLLHQLLAGYLPARLIERPKMGFGIPLAAWLRGPLRAWSEDVLRGLDGAAGSLFDRAEVLRLWSEHQGGVRNWQVMLWNMLVLLTWLEDWKAAPGQPHRQCELVPSGN